MPPPLAQRSVITVVIAAALLALGLIPGLLESLGDELRNAGRFFGPERFRALEPVDPSQGRIFLIVAGAALIVIAVLALILN